MTQLDDHGARIVAFIERYQRQHHRSPSYEEIGAGVGITSKDHVSRDLKRLQKQGFITFTPRVGRSIVLLRNSNRRTGRHPRAIPLPIVGTLQPDRPVPAAQETPPALDWLTIGRELLEDEAGAFVLRVQGNSMVDALVNDGDLVVIKPQEAAQNGEMVAVWLKREQVLALKYYYRENGRVRLQAANPALPPLHLPPEQVEIRGQVLAIVRKAASQPGAG